MNRAFDLKLLVLVILAHAVVNPTAHSQDESMTRIFAALTQASHSLTGYKVTALETNVMFSQQNSPSIGSAQTNICSYVYKFKDKTVSISCKRFDLSGTQTYECNTLIADGAIWSYENQYEADGNRSISGWGKIELQGKSILVGVPVFLSKFVISEFIQKSPSAILEKENSSTGFDCYVVKISTPPKSVVKSYKLFLNSDTLTPIEINSYLPNGKLYSLTTLQFRETEDGLSICKQAESKLFLEGVLFNHSTWISVSAEKETSQLDEDLESFFPPRTRVSDRRFAKLLSYHMGRRLPNSNEIQLMLTTTNAVRIYEAASTLPGVSTGMAAAQKKPTWPILFLLACASFGPLAYWAFSRVKSKAG